MDLRLGACGGSTILDLVQWRLNVGEEQENIFELEHACAEGWAEN